MKQILAVIIALVVLFTFTFVPCFAQETTTNPTVTDGETAPAGESVTDGETAGGTNTDKPNGESEFKFELDPTIMWWVGLCWRTFCAFCATLFTMFGCKLLGMLFDTVIPFSSFFVWFVGFLMLVGIVFTGNIYGSAVGLAAGIAVYKAVSPAIDAVELG